MKVLHVITGLGQGGAEGVLFRLLKCSAQVDEHLVVSLGRDGFYKKKIEALGVPVRDLKMSGFFGFLRGLRSLFSLIRESRPDVIQTWMYHADFFGGLAGWICQVPVVWGVRQSEVNLQSVSMLTYLLCRVNALLSWIIPKSIVNCSNHSIEVHSRIGYCRSKFRFVPNGYNVDVDFKRDREVRPTWHFPEAQFVIGHAARVDPVKNHPLFIDSILKVLGTGLPVQALLVGNGTDALPDMSEFKFSAEYEKFCFVGPVSEMDSFYRSCDCLVLSSDWEGFPNVVAEAMTFRVPCIVTDVGDAALIVDDTGWVVPVRNSDAMSIAIQSAFAEKLNPDVWERRCDKARARILNLFSINQMTNNFKAVWENAVGAR